MKKIGIFLILIVIFGLGYGAWYFLFGREKLDFSGNKKLFLIDDGLKYEMEISEETVGDFLEKNNLLVKEGDLVFPDQSVKIFPSMTVVILRAKEVTILADGEKIEKKVLSSVVDDALNEAGLSISHLDKVDPGRKMPVVAGATIEITRINVEEVEVEEKIAFKTIEKEDNNLRWRKKEIKQVGENGINKVKYEITYKNGKEVGRKKIAIELMKKPVDEIVSVGTKVEVGQTKTGLASWYRFEGGMFCASRIFPRGTWLRVTNRATGKQIFVQVNDFGPMRGTGKMIDLDAVAFEKLSPLGAGVIEVKVEEILE